MKVTVSKLYLWSLIIWSFSITVLINSHYLALIDSRIYGGIAILIRCMLCFIIIKSYKEAREFLSILVVLFFCLLSLYVTKSTWLLEICLILLASKGVEVRRIVRCIFFAQLLAIIVVFGGYFLGIIDTTLMERESGRIRNALGFHHPNGTGALLLQLSLLLVYLRDGKLHFEDFLMMGGFIFLCSQVVHSQTNVVLLCGLFLLSISAPVIGNIQEEYHQLWYLYIRPFQHVLSIGMLVLPIVCVLIASQTVGIPNLASIDADGTLLSRVWQMQYYYNYYDNSLLGTPLRIYMEQKDKMNLFTLDNGYTYLYLGYGQICFGIYLLLNYMRMRKTIQENQFVFFTILMIYGILGISETSILQWNYNFTLILLYSYAFGKNRRSKS